MSAAPILLLHGNPTTGAMWDDVIARLPGRRCLAPDLPGFGSTPELPALDLASLAGWVERLDVPAPFDLVVHDIGGCYGLAFAVEHPERVRRIVVTNSFFHRDFRWHFWGRVWRTRGLGELSMLLFTWPAFVAEMRRGARKLTREQLRAMWSRITPATRRHVLRFYRAMDPARLAGWDDRLQALAARVPVTVVWGDRDPYIDKSFAERFGARDVHHLADVGHFVPLEAPDELARRIGST